MRKLNVERMKRYRARHEPNHKVVVIPAQEIEPWSAAEAADLRDRYFRTWMDKMMIKHKGKDGRFEFMQEQEFTTGDIRITGRVFTKEKE